MIHRNGKYGYINKKGKEVIKLKYDWGGDFSEGLAAVKMGNKRGFINNKGKVVIPIKYDVIESFSEGLAFVSKDGNSGYVNKKGKFIKIKKSNSGEDYEIGGNFSEGLTFVYDKNFNVGFINKKGKLVIPYIFRPYNGGF